MANRKAWFAVLASVVILGALVGLFFLTRPAERAQLLPLQPWYLREGATLTWEVQRDVLGESYEELVTHRVKEVANETIVLYRDYGGRTRNETFSLEHMEEWYSTLAARFRSPHVRPFYQDVTYQAALITYDAGGQSFAAFEESVSFESIVFGSGMSEQGTSEQITDLTTFARLYSNDTLRVDIAGQPPRWVNASFRLASFQGLEPIPVERMDVVEMRFEDASTPVHAFNAPNLSIGIQGRTVHVGFVAAQEALITSLIDRRTMHVLDVVPGNTSQSLVPINETHSLLRVRTSPGSFQFTLTLGQEPAMIAASPEPARWLHAAVSTNA